MAAAGVASRRKCEELIAAGRVSVNGERTTAPGTAIDPHRDRIALDGKLLQLPEQHVYLVLNKPEGYLVAARDMRGRKTIYELLGDVGERVVPVGRLDMNSSGLLLLTNDGELTHRLMHPRYHVEKEYEVDIEGSMPESAVERLRRGVEIEDYTTRPAHVRIIARLAHSTRVSITISEGKKRQVRLMCAEVGYPVARLKRVREGPVRIGKLPEGKWRNLEPGELSDLRQAAGLSSTGK